MPIFNVAERLTLGSSALLLYPQKSCACTTILFTALKKTWWTVSAGNTTYSPTLLSDTCVSISQHSLRGVEEGQRHCALHCLQKDTPFPLGGGPVSLPVGTSETTTLLGFPRCQRVVTFPFCFSNATNCSGGHFLPSDSGMQGSSDVESAVLEVFFFDPATLDFVLGFRWTLPFHAKTSTFTNTNWQNGLKTITIATSFFLWRFFLSFGYHCHDVSIGEFNDSMVSTVDGWEGWLIISGVCEKGGTS